jgi:hypothetical protein
LNVVSLVSAAVLLLGTVIVGVLAHELCHALALRIAGVSCAMEFFPGRGASLGFPTVGRTPLARVTPTGVSADVSPWHLRVASMTPLCLAIPIALVFLGVVPNPFATGDLGLQLVTIAWLGCSIPSPADFSLLWYPERALENAELPADAPCNSRPKS